MLYIQNISNVKYCNTNKVESFWNFAERVPTWSTFLHFQFLGTANASRINNIISAAFVFANFRFSFFLFLFLFFPYFFRRLYRVAAIKYALNQSM